MSVCSDDTGSVLSTQTQAAQDVAAATLALQDALYRLTAGMSRTATATDVADRLQFASLVRHGYTATQQTQWLALRAVALEALDVLAGLYPTVAAAPALLEQMSVTAERYATDGYGLAVQTG